MKVICAWCGKKLGTDKRQPRNMVSHGICKPCSEKLKAQAKECLVSGDPEELFLTAK